MLTQSVCSDFSTNTAQPYTHVGVQSREYLLVFPSKKYVILNIDETESGAYLVTNPSIMTHGVGSTPDDAINDFLSMFIDLFKELVESESVLAPNLKGQLNYLQYLIGDE